MVEATWPEASTGRRYRVRFRTPESEHEYTAATLYRSEKAVVLATQRHLHLYDAEGDLRRRILDATVEDMGPIAQDARGVLQPEGSDLVDRWEW